MDKYIAEQYGKRSPDFVKGFLAAMDYSAIYINGERYIGCRKEPLKEVMIDVVEALAENPEDFTKEIERYFK